jgi:tRNA (adenine-N(1)-)-methyltransferase non-catalytic subunit
MEELSNEIGTTQETEATLDPLMQQLSTVVQEGDYVILVFADGRQVFAQCLKSWRGKSPPVKINKRSYPTSNLIGLPYGTVLELGSSKLCPLAEGEDVIPKYPDTNKLTSGANGSNLEDAEAGAADNTFPSSKQNDNRNLVDDNRSQGLNQSQVERLRKIGMEGAAIVGTLIENSATFENKSEFSKAKYVAKKQMKYQQRCRMVRCTPYSVCEAMFLKEPRKMLNLREDTLGQILSYSNVCAGCQVLVMDNCMGVVTGALAQRMGGYGKVISVYNGQQPAYLDMIARFNLTFAENHSIKWVHSGDVFNEDVASANDLEEEDSEKVEREALAWPCPLQDHTRGYLEKMGTEREKSNFLAKRCARFARKLTRHTPMEAKAMLNSRKCDSVIIATRYDPTATLLELLPHLAPSSPFVVFCEFIEPLAECFRELQKQSLAINIRLSDTWMREYQVLPGRTHPNMNMSQSGGFLLTGIKLCPVTGHNELDDSVIKEIKEKMGGRRGRKNKHNKNDKPGSKRSRSENGSDTQSSERDSKSMRLLESKNQS